MIADCPFLKIGVSAGDLRCAAGVNFVSVGAGRELCQMCELEDLGDMLACPHLDVYTYYTRAQDGAHVTVKLTCLLDDLPIGDHCAECPSRRASSS